MSYDNPLAARVHDYLSQKEEIRVVEKKMFGGLAFMVNGKMCINVSGNRLMCRFDPALTEQLSHRQGFNPMVMKGKSYKGYCYVTPEGYLGEGDFSFWIELCLSYNKDAPIAKQRNPKQR
ncbi:MAG TPA: TfoX/Sxy family protein [Cyclobacteriaceae bacterium]|nr:TfoX/Sxy family protein [Cyclobacteriaceae bacterium]